MAKKSGKREPSVEELLTAVLESFGWQAKLIQAALEQVRQWRRGGVGGAGSKTTPARRR